MNEATSEATEQAQFEALSAGVIGRGEYDPETGIFEWYDNAPLGAVVGSNVKRLREEQMLTQHELAQQWKRHGLNWSRSKLSALEAGSRPQVSLADVVIMALTLKVPLRELFNGPADAVVQLAPNQAVVMGEHLRLFLSGGAPEDMALVSYWHAEPRTEEEDDALAPQQADLELAQRLGLDPSRVLAVARGLFGGHTLTQERDLRVARMGASSTHERQAHRGHVTRELSEQIRAALEETP